MRRKPIRKHQRACSHDLPRCVRNGSCHARRKFKESPYFEHKHEDQKRQLHRREKMCTRSGEYRNVQRCTEKDRETSQMCSREVERSNSYKSDDSLNKKNSVNTDLKSDKSEYHV